jgi:hypothetical protein
MRRTLGERATYSDSQEDLIMALMRLLFQ